MLSHAVLALIVGLVLSEDCNGDSCKATGGALMQVKSSRPSELQNGISEESLLSSGSKAGSKCMHGCYGEGTQDWSHKCGLTFCSACQECMTTTTATTTTAGKCMRNCYGANTKDWSHKCGLTFCAGCQECTAATTTTSTPMPVSCDWRTEETCFGTAGSPVACASITEGGCPCPQGETKCGADEYYAGWCQAGPCPVNCDPATEETCWDDNGVATHCEPFSVGCPCPQGQIRCGAELAQNYSGWCQHGPCPVQCDSQTEHTCWDASGLAVSCANKTVGCPCPGDEVRCGADEHDEGYCEQGPCPVNCNYYQEETCWDDNWNAVGCALISEGGCPCKGDQVKCGAVPDDNYAGYCTDAPCPLTCNWKTHETCYDDNWVAVSCANITEGGCPCKGGQVKCGAQLDSQYPYAGWCQDGPCPLTCNWETEESCYDENWVVQSCAKVSDGGCACPAGQSRCGQFLEDDIVGWCQDPQWGECGLQCNWKKEETCYDDSWQAVSCALISDGGCPCLEGQEKCGAYTAETNPWGEDCSYAGYCTEPEYCYASSAAGYLQNSSRVVGSPGPRRGNSHHDAELVLKLLGQYHVFDTTLGMHERYAGLLRKELRELKIDLANVQLHRGHLNKTLSSFLKAHRNDAIEFAAITGNQKKASNLLQSLRPHLHDGAVLNFRDLSQTRGKKQLNDFLAANHKAGMHLAPIKQDSHNELIVRVTK